MIDVVTALLELMPWPALCLAVAVLAYLESAALVGLVVPGESAVLLGAALGARAGGPLPMFVAATAAAAVAGDLTGHAIGRRWGARLRSSWVGRRIGPDRWARSDRFLRERGGLAVLTGRFLPMAQALVPLLAGSAGMPRRRFLLWSLGGAAAWSAVYVTAGFLAGATSGQAGASLATVGLVAVLAVLVLSTLVAKLARIAAGARA